MQSQTSGEPFVAQVIEIEALHDRDMVEHRRIMAPSRSGEGAAHHAREGPRRAAGRYRQFRMLGDLLGTPVVAVNSMSRTQDEGSRAACSSGMKRER